MENFLDNDGVFLLGRVEMNGHHGLASDRSFYRILVMISMT